VTSLGIGTAGDMPDIAGHTMTLSALALVIRRHDIDTLTVINKDNGSLRQIALSGPTLHIDTLAHAGDILLVSQQLATGEGLVSLSRIELGNNDAITSLSSSASLVTVINSPGSTLAGEADHSHLIWREGAAVLSHTLSTNKTVIIADGGTLNGWDGSDLKANNSNLSRGLLSGHSTSQANAEALWLFDATKALVTTER
jgi:hypothetical protein